MLQKRKHFISTEQEFSFSQVPQSSHLYIYKHHCPQIVVRFPSPTKTIIGFDVRRAQIIYWPFYEDVLAQIDNLQGIHENKQLSMVKNQAEVGKIEKVQFPYKGQLILNKESQIFVEFLKRQLQALIEQSKNPPPRKRNLPYRPQIKIQISEVFQILIDEWFSNPFINAIFLCTEKHLKTFNAYDHGFIKIQVLKTSLTNIQLPFYKSPTAKMREVKEIDNKHYFFQFESSVLYKDRDFTDVEKVGVLMPRPISINQFFYEVLIQMFNEFQQEVEKQNQKQKKRQQRMRIKESLLQNFRNMGLQPNFLNQKNIDDSIDLEPKIQIDPLDDLLNEIFGKKKRPKEEENKKQNTSSSQIEPSTVKQRRESVISVSPEKKQENQEDVEDDETKPKQSPKKLAKIQNIKVIRSFTSEIIDDDFEARPQRRFVTKGQFDKLIRLAEKIVLKREEKLLKEMEQRQLEEGGSGEVKLEKKQELVYLGMKSSKKSSKSSPQKVDSVYGNFVFDYFSNHHETVILGKRQQEGNEWGERSREKEGNPFEMRSRDEEVEPIVIPGLEDISVIEKRGRQKHSKIKGIDLMYEGSDQSINQGIIGGGQEDEEQNNEDGNLDSYYD